MARKEELERILTELVLEGHQPVDPTSVFFATIVEDLGDGTVMVTVPGSSIPIGPVRLIVAGGTAGVADLGGEITDAQHGHRTEADAHRHSDLLASSVTADQHHAEDHVLATGTALGTHHTISGAALGYVLRALSATTAKFMQLVHGDLGSVGPDDHHNRDHSITGATHTTFPGGSTNFLREDGSWANPPGAGASGGTPAVVLGTAPAAGVAGTFLRDDDTIVAFDATSPTASAVGDSGAVGSVALAARRDHKHAREAFAGTGSATTVAHSDHSHSGAGGAVDFAKLAQVVLGADTATISFTSIDGSYENLRLVLMGRTDENAVASQIVINFNADTGANYDYKYTYYSGATTVGGSNAVAQTAFKWSGIAGNTAPANAADLMVLDIPAYARTVFQKSVLGHGTEKDANSTGSLFTHFFAGWWRDTSAITQIDITLATGGVKFKTGTVATLYGTT